ncbi:MAG: hypothetical protein IBJ12_09555 [Sphingomonadaceae bacterium]|nr:hypothetical protein [Sphingomonadaceae bacterium]
MTLRNFLLPLAFVASAVAAHHGWSSYDASKTLTIDATLSDLSWGNPHGQAKTRYKGKTWTVIFAPVSRMESRGLTKEMVGPKRKVRLVGYARSDGTPEMRIERVIVGDKTVELR